MAGTTIELRSNWEPERSILGWFRAPAERYCRFCRRNLHHTKEEHDLLYPIDRKEAIAKDKAESDAQAAKDRAWIADRVVEGMTEEQAEEAWWRALYREDI